MDNAGGDHTWLVDGERPPSPFEVVKLLDSGEEAYPPMLEAIVRARRTVYLEVYTFTPSGVGRCFIEALRLAAARGVEVTVIVDGWGSARGGNAVAAALRRAGCRVRIYNRLLAVLVGRFCRNHRKVLLVDDEVAFLGGINIGDENIGSSERPGWADLAVEIRGRPCALLGQLLRGEPPIDIDSSLRIHLCGPGGGWRLRRRYLQAFASARRRVDLAHGYFLPDPGLLRVISEAARRGVQVRLLLAGRSDVPFSRVATRSLHRRLLKAGVAIYEWKESVLHAKLATIDGERLLLGSFNLDPFSLANLETLVEVVDPSAVEQGETWLGDHLSRSHQVMAEEARPRVFRWIIEPFGRVVACLVGALGRILSARKRPESRTQDRAERALRAADQARHCGSARDHDHIVPKS